MHSLPVPTTLELDKGTVLRISWGESDEYMVEFPAWDLRVDCHCAACVNEMSGKRFLDPDQVPKDITMTDAQLTGAYGLSVNFSDGHSTGIYTWIHLVNSIPDKDLQAKILALPPA